MYELTVLQKREHIGYGEDARSYSTTEELVLFFPDVTTMTQFISMVDKATRNEVEFRIRPLED